MKTLDLLRSLSKKEWADFEVVMTNHKRSSLKKLYFFLKSRSTKENTPAKSVIFEAAFGSDYTSKKDYKLRHELRLLNEELTHFLMVKQFESQLKSNPHFQHIWEMKMLENRQLHKHSETAFKQYFEKAKSEFQPQLAHQMLNIHINSLISNKDIRLELYQKIYELLEDKKQLLQQHFDHKIHETNVKQAFAARVIRIMQPDFAAPSLLYRSPNEEEKDAFSQLLLLEAQSYLETGLKKISTLTQLLEQLESCNFEWLQYNRRKMVTLSNIALTYYLLGKNKEAHHFYELAIEHTQINKQQLPIEVLFNHFSNLVKMEYYQKALDIYALNESSIESYPKVQNRFLCLKAMCHVLLGAPQDALQCIPPNIRQLPPDQYYYLRFILLIIFYQTDDWAGGLRETENFLKVLNYVKEPHFDVDYKQLAHFYLDFFKAVSDTPTIQKQNLTILQSSIKACKNITSAHNDHLLLIWLEKEVEKLL